MKTILLSCLGLFILTTVGCKTVADPLRLTHKVVPLSQRILLNLDPADDGYSGSVIIDLQISEPTKRFRFHAKGLDIHSVTIQHGKENLTPDYTVGEKGTLTVIAPKRLHERLCTLTVRFSGTYSRKGTGIYKVDYEGRPYLFTQMEPEHAREAFPCWDAPEFKIPWQMILETPTEYTALANTPVENTTHINGTRRTIFKKGKPMPSYLLALAVGEFDHKAVDGMSIPGNIYTAKDKLPLAENAIQESAPLLKYLEEYFDIPYPYAKLDQISVSEFNFGAMENVGLITYKDRVLLAEPGTQTLNQRQSRASIIAHEMAHTWFGNLVTLEWWDDLWLNESFASWMATKTVNAVYPELELQNKDMGARKRAMGMDALSSTRPIRRPVAAGDGMHTLFDSLAYSKGMAVLNMIENWLGEEPFREGIMRYMEINKWKNADAFDLAAALNSVDDSDVNTIMRSYITQPGIPFISIEQIGHQEIRVRQERYRHYKARSEDVSWAVPVVLAWSDGEKEYQQKILLTEPYQDISLPAAPVWIYPNADEKGYYCWELDSAPLQELASKVTGMHERRRIGFLYNLDFLFSAGKLSGADYMRILAAFKNDPSPDVRKFMLDALDSIHGNLISSDQRQSYGDFIGRTVRPMLKSTGFTKAEGEKVVVENLRNSIIWMLGHYAHDPEVLDIARKQAHMYMKDPTAVDPSLAQTYLSLAAQSGSEVLYDHYVKHYESETVPDRKGRYLSALSQFRDPDITRKALAYALTPAVPPQQCGSIVHGLASREDNRQLIFDWLKENYEPFTGKLPGHYAEYLPWIVSGQSIPLLNQAEAFFKAQPNYSPGMQRTLDQVRNIVVLNAALRKKESASISAFLQSQQEFE